MAFWDKWEEIVRNEGEPEADAFYAKHETLMLAGSEVSWSARPLLALMKIRAREGHDAFDHSGGAGGKKLGDRPCPIPQGSRSEPKTNRQKIEFIF
jgi:hypothetical protein